MRFTSQLRLSLPHRYFIRLNKDVKAMGDLSYVQCTFTEDPSALLLNYKDSIYNGTRIPTRFMIKVSKYYPHQSPVVTCLEVEFSATFVSPEGEILHSHLQNQWSALGTIKTVVDIIQSVRPHFVQTGMRNVTNSSGGIVTPTADKRSYGVGMIASPDCLSMEC